MLTYHRIFVPIYHHAAETTTMMGHVGENTYRHYVTHKIISFQSISPKSCHNLWQFHTHFPKLGQKSHSEMLPPLYGTNIFLNGALKYLLDEKLYLLTVPHDKNPYFESCQWFDTTSVEENDGHNTPL